VPREDVADEPLGVLGKLRRGVVVRGIGDVDQMMRDTALRLERHLVGADVEAAIDRRRIAVDDLAAVAFGEREPERTLS
jgi:hypothetical protein